MEKLFYLFLILLFFSNPIFSQDVILLENPSFEDDSRCCKPPDGWDICAFDTINTPDVLPGFFSVNNKAFEGKTYLGLVARSNETYEFVSQKLSSTLKGNKVYSFSISLARSLNYIARDPNNPFETISYSTPINFRIWGGNSTCEKVEILENSPLIKHIEWKTYNFILRPTRDCDYIFFEAFYENKVTTPPNGNILIDNCSEILEISRPTIYPEESIQQRLENTSDEEIYDLILKSFEKNLKTEPDSSKIYLSNIMRIWQFDKEVMQTGIRQYLYNHSQEDIYTKINCLRLFHLNKSADILGNLNDILSADPSNLSIEEITFFENGDNIYKTTSKEENIKAMVLDFIKVNKAQIIIELTEDL